MRREDWPDVLVAYIEGRELVPFVWGEHDCATLAFDWVRLAIGVDPLAAHRGLYATEFRAARILRRIGGLRALAARALPARELAFAQRGDIGIAEIEGRESYVIVEGDTLVGPGAEGLVRLRRSALVAAWEV